MNWRGAELGQRAPMFFGAVTLVVGKAILGVIPVERPHAAIPRDFGQNGGTGHRIAEAVAADQG